MARRYTPHSAPLGDRLAPKLAVLVRHILSQHLKDTAEHRAKIGTQAAVDFWKTVSEERDEHWGEMLDRLLLHDDAPDWHRKAMSFVRHGHGEAAAMAALSLSQGVAFGTVGQLFAAELAPVIHRELSNLGNQLVDPGVAAGLAAQRIFTVEEAVKEAGGAGYNHQRSERMIESAHAFPGLAESLELLRRGEISEAAFDHNMRRTAVPEQFITHYKAMRWERLPPADLALMVLKGIITEDEAKHEAGEVGISPHRLERLVLATGEPIGLEQMLEAYRRKFMDRKRLEHGVRQSRVRNEWLDVIEKLRFQRASPSDALKAVVQNHLSRAEGKQIAEENGLDPRDWDWLVETEGNPLGPMQMIQLLRRGKMSRKQVEQGIRESRIKNKYIQPMLHLERQIPSLFQINSVLKSGGMSEAEGSKLLLELGYDKNVVKGLVHAAVHGAAAKDKELAKAEVEELYYDHAITHEQALTHLKAIGLHGHNATLALSLVDLRREKALRQAAMGPIRGEYIARRIDATAAKQKLTALGLPVRLVEFAVQMWTVDREARTKLLSEAQIVKANTQGLLSDVAAEQKLMALGYHREDAMLLLDMEKGRRHPAP